MQKRFTNVLNCCSGIGIVRMRITVVVSTVPVIPSKRFFGAPTCPVLSCPVSVTM